MRREKDWLTGRKWEMLYNPNFNCTEFDTIRNAAGSNNYVLYYPRKS